MPPIDIFYSLSELFYRIFIVRVGSYAYLCIIHKEWSAATVLRCSPCMVTAVMNDRTTTLIYIEL